MKSSDDVLHRPAGGGDTSVSTADLDALGTNGTGIIVLDDSALPPPVSSFDHVARLTAGAGSLVPRKAPWPFSLRAHPHRTER